MEVCGEQGFYLHYHFSECPEVKLSLGKSECFDFNRLNFLNSMYKIQVKK